MLNWPYERVSVYTEINYYFFPIKDRLLEINYYFFPIKDRLFLFVCVDALHPSQQYFSHLGTISCPPGLKQY